VTILSFAVSGTNLFAGGDGLFLSTNNGTSWTTADSGLTSLYVSALAVSDTNIFAGTADGVFLSTNNGTSWTAVDAGLTDPDGILPVSSLAVSPNEAGGTNLYAGTEDGGVFLSTNNGASWTAVNSGLGFTSGSVADVCALTVSGTNVFAGVWSVGYSPGGVFVSTNNGTNWTAVNTGLTISSVHALAVSGRNLFAGTSGGGVFLSTNSGTSWNPLNRSYLTFDVLCFALSDSILFAGTDGGGIAWVWPVVTAIGPPRQNLPTSFKLEQNFPNPFNPTTTITYRLPAISHVTLKIYDILGREVAILVNAVQSEGEHTTKFDGSKFASGVYLYRLDAIRSDGETFVAMKRMVLLK
jgi:hypothetical protein